MTALAPQQVVRPEDAFQDFFRSYPVDEESKYRKRLAQIAVSEGRSLVVDFEDLISFDPDLARKLVTKPDEYLRYAESAAISQMKVEDPEYAEQVGRLFVRFRRLPEKKALRRIGAEHLNQMVLVDGIIVRVTQVKPMIVKAKFQCRKCLEIIVEAAADPWIHRNLVSSLAPSIYGYDDIKEGVLYLLFGGVPKHMPDGINIRGDSNTLIIGDPGTAKSQLLQYVSRIAPRGLYTSGRGTTAAGLTAAVLREKTGGMVLEAGAMVLADKGVACIDELDKMRPDDRVAIHEALEQQTVSVAKGGIVATLNARAAVLAAANPALGRYEPHKNINENINLPVTILSRFDLIFIIKDQPEPDYDSRMSEHILALHRSKVSPETAPFAPDFLRKYISFAKRITPVLTPEAVIELRDFYLKMRSKGGEEAAVAITPRQLEALVRISEARARAFLRDSVTVEDAKSAIRIMTVSLSDVGVDVKTGAMDIDVIMTGKPRSLRDSFQRVIETVAEMERETGTVEETVIIAALVDKEKMEEREARRLIGQLIKEGIL